jgi:protocatechuate 3,4-dioxygenase beta subunit
VTVARLGVLLLVSAAFALNGLWSQAHAGVACRPTAPDALGPFYEPGAPVRSKVGSGYVLRGRVLSARTCRPIARARIEFWLVNPQGSYDDDHRATVFAGRDGRYRFESNRPIGYQSRPPHIHVRVSKRGFRTLVTQHYPRVGRTSAIFNLVLRRS